MGMLSNLMSKIFGGAAPTIAAAAEPSKSTAQTSTNAPVAPAPSAGVSTAPPPTVDVTAILDQLAASNPEKLDWKRSIVDLMKLVGMDSSLAARKELAQELHYTGSASDSAAMNVWLHQQVIKKIAENGGKVPSELLT